MKNQQLKKIFACSDCKRPENKKDRDYRNWQDCKKGKCKGTLEPYLSLTSLEALLNERIDQYERLKSDPKSIELDYQLKKIKVELQSILNQIKGEG